MTGIISYNPSQIPAQLPVSIDYPAALALRQMAAQHDEYPQYLLAQEVSALLHYVPDLHRKMLFTSLWNTGARPAAMMPARLVPLSDPQFIAQLEIIIATLRIPLERRNPGTGQTEKVRL